MARYVAAGYTLRSAEINCILDAFSMMGLIAAVTNGAVIAFRSQFIERTVYHYDFDTCVSPSLVAYLIQTVHYFRSLAGYIRATHPSHVDGAGMNCRFAEMRHKLYSHSDFTLSYLSVREDVTAAKGAFFYQV